MDKEVEYMAAGAFLTWAFFTLNDIISFQHQASPLGFLVPALNTTPPPPKPKPAPPKPTLTPRLTKVVPPALAKKELATLKPSTTTTKPTTPAPLPERFGVLKNLIDRPPAGSHDWIGPRYPENTLARGITQTLQIKDDFGMKGVSPVNIYSSGMYEFTTPGGVSGRSGEIIFLSTDGKPQDQCGGNPANCKYHNQFLRSKGNHDPVSNDDGIYVAVNAASVYKFSAPQVKGHIYKTRIIDDGKNITYTLDDLTAKSTESFTDKDTANANWRAKTFAPGNEWHSSSAGPSHVRYNIQSLDNKYVITDPSTRTEKLVDPGAPTEEVRLPRPQMGQLFGRGLTPPSPSG